jgi:hypothetical protein
MFDEVETLRENPDLQRLLDHYARVGDADREAWQDRLKGETVLKPETDKKLLPKEGTAAKLIIEVK